MRHMLASMKTRHKYRGELFWSVTTSQVVYFQQPLLLPKTPYFPASGEVTGRLIRRSRGQSLSDLTI